MDEFELVRQMRIDFNLIPIKKNVVMGYPPNLKHDMLSKVKKLLLFGEEDPFPDGREAQAQAQAVKIFGLDCEGEYAHNWGELWWDNARRHDERGRDEQLRDGDHSYIVVRGPTLDSFVRRFPGDGGDWEDKFEKARRYLITELNCTLLALWDPRSPSHVVITHLHPSQNARLFVNLVSAQSPPPPPTLLLKGLGPSCFAPAIGPSFENFLRSLAKIRDLHVDQMRGGSRVVSIQFDNYKQCYKALKKLCSHTLKNKTDWVLPGEERVIDYQLTLKDNSLVSSTFDEVLAYKCNSYKAYDESATTQALNNRVLMLEKEFNLVKSLTEENSKDYDFKGSSTARALNLRAEMLVKRLEFVKYVMEDRFGAADESPSSSQQALRNRVSMLDKELSTIKVVLEDSIIGRVQALEIQVAMLKKEVNTIKDTVIKQSESGDGRNEESPMDGQAQRLRRD